MHMKSLCLLIAAIATSAGAHGDCVDRLLGSWELDMDRAAIGRSDKHRQSLREYYNDEPFMRFTFTATTIGYAQFDRQKWSETQTWPYEVAKESEDTCEVRIPSDEQNEPYASSMRLEFDARGFCHHADGEIEITDCYVRLEGGFDGG